MHTPKLHDDILVLIASFLSLADKRTFRLLNKNMEKKMDILLFKIPKIMKEEHLMGIIKRSKYPIINWHYLLETLQSRELQEKINRAFPSDLRDFKGTHMEDIIPTVRVKKVVHYGYETYEKPSEDDVIFRFNIGSKKLNFSLWLKYCRETNVHCLLTEDTFSHTLISYDNYFGYGWLKCSLLDKTKLREMLQKFELDSDSEYVDLLSRFICTIVGCIMKNTSDLCPATSFLKKKAKQ